MNLFRTRLEINLWHFMLITKFKWKLKEKNNNQVDFGRWLKHFYVQIFFKNNWNFSISVRVRVFVWHTHLMHSCCTLWTSQSRVIFHCFTLFLLLLSRWLIVRIAAIRGHCIGTAPHAFVIVGLNFILNASSFQQLHLGKSVCVCLDGPFCLFSIFFSIDAIQMVSIQNEFHTRVFSLLFCFVHHAPCENDVKISTHDHHPVARTQNEPHAIATTYEWVSICATW